MSDKVLIERELLKELVSSLEGEVESRYSNGIKDHPAMMRDYECDIEPVIRGKELLAAHAQAEDARDAARYRWLRKGESDDVAVVRGLGAMDYGMSAVVYTYSEEIGGDDLDAAIDAALASKEVVGGI